MLIFQFLLSKLRNSKKIFSIMPPFGTGIQLSPGNSLLNTLILTSFNFRAANEKRMTFYLFIARTFEEEPGILAFGVIFVKEKTKV